MSGKDKKLLVIAVVILLAAGGIFVWQQSTALKPGDVIIHDDVPAAADAGTDDSTSASIEIDEFEELDEGGLPAPKGGAQIVPNDE